MSDKHPTSNSKLHIGLLIDAEEMDAWICETIRMIRNSEYGSIDLIIKNKLGVSPTFRQRTPSNRFSFYLYNYYLLFDRTVYSSIPDACAATTISEIITKIPKIEIEPIDEHGSDQITPADIGTIQSYQLDVIIKFGFNRLSGDIMTHASKYGVWGFENCDPLYSERRSESFRDVMEQRGATLSELKKLTDGDDDVVLYRSYSMTNHTSCNRNYNEVCWKSTTFLPRVLHDLATLGESRFLERMKRNNVGTIIGHNHVTFSPTNIRTINLLLRFWSYKVIRKIRKLFTIEQWILLFDFHPPGLSFEFDRFKELKPPKDRFWADPHVIFYNDQYYVFIEELIYKNRRAHLSVITIGKDGTISKPQMVLQKSYHLSYPFVFKHGQDYFMIPETSEHRTIELYRCIQFPDKWEFVMNIMDNVEAVDTTLFFKDNIWWMFVNMREHSGMSFSDELFLFSSDDLFSSVWEPHPINPIVSDVRRARPAGKIFTYNDKLYRPAQDCSVRYGHKLVIHEIINLNGSEYDERIVQIIEPNWQKHIVGTHTVNYEAGITIIDAEICRK